mgnify:FL=1
MCGRVNTVYAGKVSSSIDVGDSTLEKKIISPIDLGIMTQAEIDALMDHVIIQSDSVTVEETVDKVIFRVKGFKIPLEDAEG